MLIDDIRTWPSEILARLHRASIVRKFACAKYITDIPLNAYLAGITQDLIGHVYTEGLVGFHCSKEPRPGLFTETGLRLMDPEQSIDLFLQTYINQFSADARRRLEAGLHDWIMDQQHMRARANTVWFCLIRNSVVSSGTERFFKYFGGEIIYWPFDKDTEILSVLEQIGRPVIVEALLSPDTIQFFGDDNLAKSCLSYFGRTINPGFHPYDIEGYSKSPIAPAQIIRVWEKEAFFSAYHQEVPNRIGSTSAAFDTLSVAGGPVYRTDPNRR